MNTADTEIISPEIRADMQAVMDSLETGIPVDADITKRILERARAITQRVYRENGLVEVGVSAIRELRGALPES